MHADGKLQEGQGVGLILFVENSLFSLFYLLQFRTWSDQQHHTKML